MVNYVKQNMSIVQYFQSKFNLCNFSSLRLSQFKTFFIILTLYMLVFYINNKQIIINNNCYFYITINSLLFFFNHTYCNKKVKCTSYLFVELCKCVMYEKCMKIKKCM